MTGVLPTVAWLIVTWLVGTSRVADLKVCAVPVQSLGWSVAGVRSLRGEHRRSGESVDRRLLHGASLG